MFYRGIACKRVPCTCATRIRVYQKKKKKKKWGKKKKKKNKKKKKKKEVRQN